MENDIDYHKYNPLISIIIPIYNIEDQLQRCLQSITNQTYKNIEIILVNDGSTDKSGIIAKEFTTKNINAIYIEQKNSGQGLARNIGYSKANGDYIMFVDGDDSLHPEYCSIPLKVALEENSDIIEFGYRTVFDSAINYTMEGSVKNIQNMNARKGMVSFDSSPCNKLFKKSVLEKANLNFPSFYHEDVAEIYRLVSFANKVTHIDNILYTYFKRINSTTGIKVGKKSLDYFKAYLKIVDIANETPFYYSEFMYIAYRSLVGIIKQWSLIDEYWAIEAVERANDLLKQNSLEYSTNPYIYLPQEISKQYENSNSWKITAPLRKLHKYLY